MTIARLVGVLVFGLAFLIIVNVTDAQIVGGKLGVFVDGIPAGEPTPGLPYTAEYKTTFVRTLANGTTINQTFTTVMTQDSEGRIRQEQSLGSVGDDRKMVHISDPVSRTTMNWTTGSQEVWLAHMPAMVQHSAIRMQDPAAHQPTSGSSSRGVAGFVTTAPSSVTKSLGSPSATQIKGENLGTKTINGVVAEGTRTTTTIPAGAVGNDRPLVTIREFWRSVDLNISVLEITDNPLYGVTTKELVKLDRSEPDPSLFRSPAGYTVKEQDQ